MHSEDMTIGINCPIWEGLSFCCYYDQFNLILVGFSLQHQILLGNTYPFMGLGT